MLANLYLFEFDKNLHAWAASKGGSYFRYSDDILVVIPGTRDDWDECLHLARSLIQKTGKGLEIHPEKCSAHRLTIKAENGKTRQFCELIHQKGCKNGLEYLGFRYDGLDVFLRESTRSKLNRAIVQACRSVARSHVHHNPGVEMAELSRSIKVDGVLKRVGRVEDFDASARRYKRWTFWTYARRCAHTFGPRGRKIFHQLSGYQAFARRKLESELESAFRSSR